MGSDCLISAYLLGDFGYVMLVMYCCTSWRYSQSDRSFPQFELTVFSDRLQAD
ncbi:hypothetical protein PI95_019905 [Hassallia byssoidea VB512170]|uniref:Uncharacterized protein n=1 Tax=Hassallia byssoidea VB512170 TaxID=1304833 RepID=A0A846HD90_9CYAN|nr:hypothetical protein [Hassalia byssoidea]NEU74759.1 hypothetical protein [Hassalia byssoidea VB512170]